MTPEQARKLLDGTTPGPWEQEGRPPHINCESFAIRQVGKPGVRIHGAAYGDTANIDLITAAPDMAAMIAGMRTEYTVEYQPTPDSQWHRVSDWSEEYPLIDGEELNPRERIVKRYVTAPQPLEGNTNDRARP